VRRWPVAAPTRSHASNDVQGMPSLRVLRLAWCEDLKVLHLCGCSGLRVVELLNCSRLEVVDVRGAPALQELLIIGCLDLKVWYPTTHALEQRDRLRRELLQDIGSVKLRQGVRRQRLIELDRADRACQATQTSLHVDGLRQLGRLTSLAFDCRQLGHCVLDVTGLTSLQELKLSVSWRLWEVVGLGNLHETLRLWEVIPWEGSKGQRAAGDSAESLITHLKQSGIGCAT
jgi:hypothetical protein